MRQYNVFVERASEDEVIDALIFAGYSERDLDYIIIDSESRNGGVNMTVEFDTTLNADYFIYELELEGFNVSVFEY